MSAELRRAVPSDVQAIHALISAHVGENRLLPRTVENIQSTLDSWLVAVDGDVLVGCASLIAFSSHLAEVRSLVVDAPYQGNGLGGKLVRGLVDMAGAGGYKSVFTLTMAQPFFERQGFRVTSRRHFPLKIWRDCLSCPAKFRCDEVTMVYEGERVQ